MNGSIYKFCLTLSIPLLKFFLVIAADVKRKKSWGSFLDDTRETPDHDAPTQSDLLRREIDLYATLPTLPSKDDDPLEWWRSNQHNFPCLAKLARKYLCVQATSVASERAFSGAGNIVTARRNCLKPSKVNQLCFLSANLQ